MKTTIICGFLALFLVGCCGWPCNWPDPPQPPGTRIVKVYAVHVDADVFDQIEKGEMSLFDAAKIWHKNRSLTIHFAAGEKCIESLSAEECEKIEAEKEGREQTKEEKKRDEERAEKVQTLIYSGLKIHFIEEKGLFIMTGTGRLTFGDTIVDVTDKHLWLTALEEKDEDDDDEEEIIKVAVVSNWKPEHLTANGEILEAKPILEERAETKPTEEEDEKARDENEEIDETINLYPEDSKFDNTTPRAMEVLAVINAHITKRFPSAQVREFRPEIYSRIIDLTVTPEGKWWEGVGFYPHPKKCELEEEKTEAPAKNEVEE